MAHTHNMCTLQCAHIMDIIGVRDQFRLPGGGGGGEVSCPNILSIACPKIKWFCPNINLFFFARKWQFEKF